MKSEVVHCRELEQYLSGEHKELVVRWKLFPTNIMTKELPAGIRGSKRILTRFGTLILSIRDSSPNLWPMSLVGFLLQGMLLAAAEHFEATVIVPPNVTLSVTNTTLPVPLLVIVPTNLPVQVVRVPSNTAHGCDIPITYITSNSISEGGRITVTMGKVFRRAHQNKETK